MLIVIMPSSYEMYIYSFHLFMYFLFYILFRNSKFDYCILIHIRLLFDKKPFFYFYFYYLQRCWLQNFQVKRTNCLCCFMTTGNFKAKQEEFVSCSESESSNTKIDCENIIYTWKKSSKWIIRTLLNKKKKKEE